MDDLELIIFTCLYKLMYGETAFIDISDHSLATDGFFYIVSHLLHLPWI